MIGETRPVQAELIRQPPRGQGHLCRSSSQPLRSRALSSLFLLTHLLQPSIRGSMIAFSSWRRVPIPFKQWRSTSIPPSALKRVSEMLLTTTMRSACVQKTECRTPKLPNIATFIDTVLGAHLVSRCSFPRHFDVVATFELAASAEKAYHLERIAYFFNVSAGPSMNRVTFSRIRPNRHIS
jgi:hypothetical protein